MTMTMTRHGSAIGPAEAEIRPDASWPGRLAEPYGGERYYGESPVKPAPWNWMISSYIFLAGFSGAAQGLAAIGQALDRRRWRSSIRDARVIAAAGTLAGSALLIADLRTPQRWFNMLRILRPTSPMSFGTYILGGFGASTALSLLGELPRRLGGGSPAVSGLADAGQLGAALFGVGASTYTAALMAATSAPAWAAHPRRLGAELGVSAVGSGAAALAIGQRLRGRDAEAERLEMVAAAACLGEIAISLAPASTRSKLMGKKPWIAGRQAGERRSEIAVAALPLVAYGLARAFPARASSLAALGSVAIMAGGMALRHRRLREGMRSAEDARAYFELTQPDRRRVDQRSHGRRDRGG